MSENPQEQEAVTIDEKAAEEPSGPGEQIPAQETAAGEIAAGKAFAILSYALLLIGLPFFIVPLVTRDNGFSLYHAKQCLILCLAGIAVAVISAPLMFVCVGVITGVVGGLAILVFAIIGLVNACKGETKPVPLIGKFAEDWFKGISKTNG